MLECYCNLYCHTHRLVPRRSSFFGSHRKSWERTLTQTINPTTLCLIRKKLFTATLIHSGLRWCIPTYSTEPATTDILTTKPRQQDQLSQGIQCMLCGNSYKGIQHTKLQPTATHIHKLLPTATRTVYVRW